MISPRDAIARSRRRGDAGFTMIELMIALGIFSVFLAIVLTSIVSISKASTKVQVTAQSSSAELSVFQRLDHQIRYADSINFPGFGSSGDAYIEFRTPAVSTASGITLCTQWRMDLSTRTLQSRTWNDVTGVVPPAAWQTNITNVANDGGSAYPFKMVPATGTGEQELVLTIDTGNTRITGAKIITTYVARNSSIQSPSNADESVAGTSDTPVCPAGSRP